MKYHNLDSYLGLYFYPEWKIGSVPYNKSLSDNIPIISIISRHIPHGSTWNTFSGEGKESCVVIGHLVMYIIMQIEHRNYASSGQ